MKNDDEQSSLMVAVIGIIPVIWFALLVAPYLSSGLMGILDGVPAAMKQAGIAYATDQIIDLIANGVRNIHVYSMNKPEVAAAIMRSPQVNRRIPA